MDNFFQAAELSLNQETIHVYPSNFNNFPASGLQSCVGFMEETQGVSFAHRTSNQEDPYLINTICTWIGFR